MTTLILRPSGDNTKTNWSGVGDASKLYANVDETTLNESDYNKCGQLSPYANLICKIGSTIYYAWGSEAQGFPEDATLFTWERTTNPSNSNAWTWDDIDALISGVNGFSGSLYGSVNTPILYNYPDHTSESGVISKVTFKSYIKHYLPDGKTAHGIDFQTWVDVAYTPGNKAKMIIF